MDAIATALGDWIDAAPWKSQQVMLVHIPDPDTANPITTSSTVAGKRTMLANYSPGATILVTWAGKWKTTARQMGADDVPHVRACLG